MSSGKFLLGASIGAIALVTWALTALNIGPMMGKPSLPIEATAIALFAAAWTLSMVAMMFPTAVPTLTAFLRLGRTASPEVKEGGGPTSTKALLFVGTYLGAWVATGVALYVGVAFVLGLFPSEAGLFIGSTLGLGVALILVAVYQLSPLKGECLTRCHPSNFLFRYYRGGLFGSVRMGANYAKYCVGCCWVIMVFLIVSASMGLLWMALFTGIIFLERNAPLRAWMPRLFGLGFLMAGAALVFIA